MVRDFSSHTIVSTTSSSVSCTPQSVISLEGTRFFFDFGVLALSSSEEASESSSPEEDEPSESLSTSVSSILRFSVFAPSSSSSSSSSSSDASPFSNLTFFARAAEFFSFSSSSSSSSSLRGSVVPCIGPFFAFFTMTPLLLLLFLISEPILATSILANLRLTACRNSANVTSFGSSSF